MDKQTTIDKAKQYIAAADEAEESGDFAKAVEQMDKALQLRPDFAPYWVSQGNLLRRWSKFERSEDAIRKAIEISPSASYAWTELGLLFKDREFFEKAADCLRRSVQLRPDFNTYTVLADVELTFDADAALLDAEKALELNPGWDEALQVRDAAKEVIEQYDDD